MKKNMFLAAAAVVALASCNNASPKMDEQPAAAAAGESTGNVKIAYVEVDSLMTQYEFCKEFTLILQKKSTNALVWRTSWPTRPISITRVCATHCSTSWQHIIRIRSLTLS